MSTRAEAFARLDSARLKVVTALRAAGETHNAESFAGLPAPGKQGWVHNYLARSTESPSMLARTKLEVERVKNHAHRARCFAAVEQLETLATAIDTAEQALAVFRGVLSEVLDEGMAPRGFTKAPKAAAAAPIEEAPTRARRTKASPT